MRTECSLKYKLNEKVDQSVMRWYGHMEKIGKERHVKQIYRAGMDELKEGDHILYGMMVLERCYVSRLKSSCGLGDACKIDKDKRVYGR